MRDRKKNKQDFGENFSVSIFQDEVVKGWPGLPEMFYTSQLYGVYELPRKFENALLLVLPTS